MLSPPEVSLFVFTSYPVRSTVSLLWSTELLMSLNLHTAMPSITLQSPSQTPNCLHQSVHRLMMKWSIVTGLLDCELMTDSSMFVLQAWDSHILLPLLYTLKDHFSCFPALLPPLAPHFHPGGVLLMVCPSRRRCHSTGSPEQRGFLEARQPPSPRLPPTRVLFPCSVHGKWINGQMTHLAL